MNSFRLFLVISVIGIFCTLAFLLQQSKRQPTDSIIFALNQNDKNKIVSSNNTWMKDIQNSLLSEPNRFVLKYISLPLDYAYGSNSIPLLISALISHGDMLELGMGMFSTPLLYRVAVDQNRNLVSVDTDRDWVQKFSAYNMTNNHKIYFLNDYNELSKFGQNQKWGLVLVDHIYANYRPLDVISFAQKSEIVVAHDAEKNNEFLYQYEKHKITSYFKYSCKYSIYKADKQTYTSTLIMSNYINLDILTPIFDKIRTDHGHVSCDLRF